MLTALGARGGTRLPAVATVWSQTEPVGDDAEVTFTKDVLPILQRSCQTCHRPGTAAPMALLTYEQARPWARSMKDRVNAATDATLAPGP